MTQMSGLRLYEIPAALRRIEDEIMEAEGVMSPELEDQLNGVQEQFERKAEYIALLVREAQAEAAAVKAEEDRLKALRTRAERRADGLKDYIYRCMLAGKIDRVDGERARIRIQKNSRPTIAWTRDVVELPDELRRVRVELDGQKAYELHKAGEELPDGFIVDVGSHLRIQ
jgi:hypothetical protein